MSTVMSVWRAILWVVPLLMIQSAIADDRHEGRGNGSEGGRGAERLQRDYRAEHGRNVRDLPRGHYAVYDRYHHRYFYAGGIWYAPSEWGFTIVAAPIGVFVPILQGGHTTVWIGGVEYFVANGAYYLWRSRERVYEVVDPPESQAASAETSSARSPIFVYPRNGQSEEQASRDKYECHRWAVGETGFDPTVAGGGVTAAENGIKRSDYQRASSVCLEARGYSVK